MDMFAILPAVVGLVLIGLAFYFLLNSHEEGYRRDAFEYKWGFVVIPALIVIVAIYFMM